LDELPDEAAGGGLREARDVDDIGEGEDAPGAFVQHRHEQGRARSQGFASGFMFYSHFAPFQGTFYT
jgi:hypothetical protein